MDPFTKGVFDAMATIDVKGATVAYAESGTGQPVILLHSSASSGAQWKSLRETLSSHFRVLAPDLYGYGETDPWPGDTPLRLLDEAEIVVALAERAGAPVHLVGHSYGGAVALAAALAHKDQVRSLTVIEPVAFYLLAGRQQTEARLKTEVDSVARDVGDAVLRGDSRAGMERFVDYWNGAGAWRELKPSTQGDLTKRLGKVALDFAAIAAEETSLAAYGRLIMPSLILCGPKSPAPTRHITRLLAETLPGARHRTIRNAGHMSPVTHAHLVNPVITEHLIRSAAVRPKAAPRRAA